jgi:phosphatidylethanolamine/phosphatidyl-N-methylethanolamine N-methyltransferase
LPAAANDVIKRIVHDHMLGSDDPMDFRAEIDDAARFFRAWVDRPMQMGAIAPSGQALAAAVAREIDETADGLVIELGPGTGAVTDALIQHGIAQERLVLIEFNAYFCDLLRVRYPGARIIHGDAYHLAHCVGGLALPLASAVVSGLPLYSRPVKERISLLREAFGYMERGAPFIQFTYAVTSPIPRATPGVISNGSAPVWLNLPPARIWTYRDATRIA